MGGIATFGEESNVNHHVAIMNQKASASIAGGQPTEVAETSLNQPPGPSPRRLTHDLRVRPPVLVDERELSYITGLCARSIRNHVRDGVLPRIKIGRRVLFRWPQVEAALAKLEGRAS